MSTIRQLSVLYDNNCTFCARCMIWLQDQQQRIHLEFIPLHSGIAKQRYPSLLKDSTSEELIVITDTGDVYRKDKAFIMCLYALEQYVEWSFHFSKPIYRPLIRNAYEYLSHFRFSLSKLFSTYEKNDIIRKLKFAKPEGICNLRER